MPLNENVPPPVAPKLIIAYVPAGNHKGNGVILNIEDAFEFVLL